MALQQYLRDSPAHVLSFDCESCDRSFDSEDALASIFGIHLLTLYLSSVRPVVDPSEATRLLSSTYGIRRSLPCHSTATPAIDSSIAKRFGVAPAVLPNARFNLPIVRPLDMLDVACTIAPGRGEKGRTQDRAAIAVDGAVVLGREWSGTKTYLIH
jgi:hypothetical protein